MTDFSAVLTAALHLPADDRIRLIEALWDTVPPEAEFPLHAEWAPELERRVAAIKDGTATTVSWATIREEALARLGHGDEAFVH